jgi:2'-5' RNA ligase
MRAFLALSLPDTVQGALAALQHGLRHTNCRVSWVREGNFHCTLRFLGEMDKRLMESLRSDLRNLLPGFAALEFRLSAAGAFPNSRRPAVLWVGMETLQGDLHGIQSACETAARKAGLDPEDKPFHPHITLGRVRESGHAAALRAALESLEVPDVGAFYVANVSLYQSILKPSGPEYRLIEDFSLACPPLPHR